MPGYWYFPRCVRLIQVISCRTQVPVKSNLANKVVVVTGASSGIGRETALAFARAGARVTLAARNAAALRAIVDGQPQWRDQLRAVPTDVTRDADVQQLVAGTLAACGRIDILINNAGIGMRAAIADLRLEDARQVMEVNFFGALRCIHAALPALRQQAPGPDGLRGQIVNVGSILSLIASPRNGIYSASKFALRALSDSLRLELRPEKIGVILIMPGYTDTDFFDRMIRYEGPARTTSIRGQSPQTVARVIRRACQHHRREVVLTLPAILGAWTKRLAPWLVDFSLSRMP